MQLQLPIYTIALIAAASVSSTWTFTAYEDPDYVGEIFTITDDDRCTDTQGPPISSFRWTDDSSDFRDSRCKLLLYGESECFGPSTVYPLNMREQSERDLQEDYFSMAISCQ